MLPIGPLSKNCFHINDFAPILLSRIKRLNGQFFNPWKALLIEWILFLLNCKFVWTKKFLCSPLFAFWELSLAIHRNFNFIMYSDLLPSWRKMFFLQCVRCISRAIDRFNSFLKNYGRWKLTIVSKYVLLSSA